MNLEHERKKIGKVLSSMREEKGISKNAVSKRMGSKFEQVQSIEEGCGSSLDSLIKYLHAIRVKVDFSHIKSKVLDFIDMNRDQDDPVGDVCVDLLRDIDFGDCTTDTERLTYIKRLGSYRRGDLVGDAIEMFLKEYTRYANHVKMIAQEQKQK